MESEKISLGVNALSPALLGDRTMDWLKELCSILTKTMTTITELTVPTGVGPSGTPINSAKFIGIRGQLETLKGKVDKLQSKLVFLNENPGGASSDAKSSAAGREQVAEERKEGKEPPREPSTINDVNIAFDGKEVQTSTTAQQGTLNNPITGEIYGERSTDAKTWKYDQAYKKWTEDTSSFDDSEIKGI